MADSQRCLDSVRRPQEIFRRLGSPTMRHGYPDECIIASTGNTSRCSGFSSLVNKARLTERKNQI